MGSRVLSAHISHLLENLAFGRFQQPLDIFWLFSTPQITKKSQEKEISKLKNV
jgi:hypothetical protein